MKLPIPSNQSVHFIGIGGAGMSALATILLGRNIRVSGSDMRESDSTRELSWAGAEVSIGHDAACVGLEGAGLVVVSTAIRADNPELEEARRRGLTVWHRAKLLSAVMDDSEASLAVCGTHGKSTTSAMAALALARAGVEPTIAMGAALECLGGNARAGAGRVAVAEVDESDGSFLGIRPTHAIVTNIDTDHLDHFGSLESLREAFRLFLGAMKPGGAAVLCADCAGVRAVAEGLKNPPVTYSLFPRAADARARDLQHRPGGSSFEVDWRGHALGRVELAVPGLHNIRNALAVVAMMRLMDIEFDVVAGALKEFRGVARRFQTIGERAGTRIVDDYAHHPSEVQATLGAARGATIPGGRVIALFQPHRFSRTKMLAEQFGEAFHDADEVIVTDVYAAGETPIEGVSGRIVHEAVERSGHPSARYCATLDEACHRLRDMAREGDLILTMGAGDVWRAGRQLLAMLSAEPAHAPAAAV